MTLRLSSSHLVSTVLGCQSTTLSDFTSSTSQIFGGKSSNGLPHLAVDSSASSRGRKHKQFSVNQPFIEYEDMSHVEFYNPVRCGKKMKGEFKRLKSLLKDSKKKLTLIASASTLQAETADTPISESNESLTSTSEVFRNEVLQHLNEIKSQLKNLHEQAKKNQCSSSSSSSSSSSESSDSSGSEMNTKKKVLERRAKSARQSATVIDALTSTNQLVPLVITLNDCDSVSNQSIEIHPNPNQGSVISSYQSESSNLTKVEVCMGGKCRRNGANEILAALEDKVRSGAPILPSPCGKCMGKCKAAPNVKVRENDGSSTMHNFVSVNEIDMILSEHSTKHRLKNPCVLTQ